MKVTREYLLAIMPTAKDKVDKYLPYINGYADMFNINTPNRMANFLVQVAHETAELVYMRELGNAAYCYKYEVGKLGKMLGNTKKGDGYRYKGRGFLHLTGRANYQAYTDSRYCKGNVVESPQLLEQPLGAVKSGMWYWLIHGLNALADKNDIVGITKVINGGTNGLESRKKYWYRALEANKKYKIA